jgi:hypothetical protein
MNNTGVTEGSNLNEIPSLLTDIVIFLYDSSQSTTPHITEQLKEQMYWEFLALSLVIFTSLTQSRKISKESNSNMMTA